MIVRDWLILFALLCASSFSVPVKQQLRQREMDENENSIEIFLLNSLKRKVSMEELTISPTLQPTLEPFSIWSNVPTTVTSVKPSSQPSSVQTIRPSLSSTNNIFTYSPSSISSSPSVNIVTPEEETFLPTIAPTEEPSAAPTEDPTWNPSELPQSEATIIPSLVPTTIPTLLPTFSPTFSPTPIPSFAPSFLPTFSPTVEPTIVPTVESSSPSQQSIVCTYLNTTDIIIQDFNRTMVSIGLMDSNFNYSTSRLLYVKQNLTMALRTLNLFNYPTQISSYLSISSCVSPYSSQLNHQFLAVSCVDSQRVNMMWLSFLSNRPFSVMCSGSRWLASICPDSSYRVCTNCTNPCVSLVTSKPGESSLRWASAVGFQVQPFRNPWPEWSQKTIPRMFDVDVVVNLSFVGTISCAAFPEGRVINNPMTILLAPTSASLAFSDPSASLSGTMTLSGLTPDTNYEIACVTSSIPHATLAQLGRTASMTRILQSAEVVRTSTAPLPVLSVTFSKQSIVAGVISDAVRVKLAFPLGRNVTVIPSLEYLSSDLCDSISDKWLNKSSDISQFSLDSNIQLVPSILYFSSFDASTKFVYLQASQPGCYNLIFMYRFASEETQLANSIISSVTSSESEATVAIESGNIFINCTELPVIPNIRPVSLTYDAAGIDLLLTFSDNVDLGFVPAYMVNFPCSLIAVFNHSEHSECRFSRPNLLRISIPAYLDGLIPGDAVDLFGNVMKPICPSQDESFCASLTYVPPLTAVVSSQHNVEVIAALSVPSIVMMGGNLTLDASTSTGNGGRPWQWYWTVLFNGSIEHPVALRLADTMNNGNMKWFGCIPQSIDCGTLLGDLLITPGEYVFSLTLGNFLGDYDTTSATVTVIPDYFVPSVRIVGSSFASIYVNSSLVLRVFVDSSTFVCPVPLEIDWMTYIDDTATPVSLTRANQDPRTLVLPENSLAPNHLYRFQVNVFCNTAFSVAFVERYVLPVEISTVFVTGLDTVLSLNYPFTLNGSLEYPLSVYGNPTDVVFSWSCSQIQPLNPQGCNRFYDLANVSSPMQYFSDPKEVFSPSSLYRISLVITSASFGVSITAYQTIHTLSNKTSDVPQIDVDVPELYTTSQFGYVINATVVGPSTFVATWEIASINQILYSRVFVDGSKGQFFPAVIPPNMLPSRFFYQFRLSAFVPTATCFAVSCMNPADVASITFTTTVNRPPSSGSLDVSPQSGSEDTLFSIFAHNWQDTDLPIGYEFYQSTNNGVTNRLIRQRMILSFLQTQLHVFPTGEVNATILLSCHVFDYHNARTIVSTPVNYYFQDPTWNASSLVRNAVQATVEMKRQLAGEYVLSVTAGIVDAIDKLQCYSLGEDYAQWDTAVATECLELVTVGTWGLDESASYYNQGLGVSLGVARYLKYLVSIDRRAITTTILSSVLRLYDYVTSAVEAVGLQDTEGSELVQTMLSTTDTLIDILRHNSTSSSIGIEAANNASLYILPLSSAMTTLFTLYLANMPFGTEQEFASLKYFQSSMNKNYFAQTLEINSSAWQTATTSPLSSLLTPMTVIPMTTINSNRETSTTESFDNWSTLNAAHDSVEDMESSSIHSVFISGVAFSRNIFPANGTTSYEILTVTDVLPVSSVEVLDPVVVNYEHISGAIHVQFRVFSEEAVHTSPNEEDDGDADNTKWMTMFFFPSDSNEFDISHNESNGITGSNESDNNTVDVNIDDNVEGDYYGGYDGPIVTYNTEMHNITGSVGAGSAWVLYRNCSEADNTTLLISDVTCTSEMTQGPAFTFPPIQCPLETDGTANHQNASRIVKFTCPIYSSTLGCFRDGQWFSNATKSEVPLNVSYSIGEKNSSLVLSCQYAIPRDSSNEHRKLVHSPVNVHGSTLVTGYFAVAQVTYAVQAATSRVIYVPNRPRKSIDSSNDNSHSKAQGVSYIAIVSIAVAGLLFAAFVYYKMKHFLANTPVQENQFQSTQAVVMPSVPLTTVEVLSPDLIDILEQKQLEWKTASRQQGMHQQKSSHDLEAASNGENISNDFHRKQQFTWSSFVPSWCTSKAQGGEENETSETKEQNDPQNNNNNNNNKIDNNNNNNTVDVILTPSGVDLSTVPFIESAQVEMVRIDAIAFPYRI